MREVAIVGVGMTKFGTSEKTQLEMFSEAAMDALAESNLKPKDIEALYIGNAYGGLQESQRIMGGYAAEEIGCWNVPAPRFESACSSSTFATIDAIMAIAAGYYDIMLVSGVERQQILSTPWNTKAMAAGHSFYEMPTGLSFPGVFGMATHLYAHRYSIPLPELKEAMALVAITNHENGAKNPKAQYQVTIRDMMERRKAKAQKEGKPLPIWSDEMDYLHDLTANPMIASPLQLFDCCPLTDGAAAAVLAPLDIAKKFTPKPVLIVGFGASSAGTLCGQKDFSRVKPREASAKKAYDMAGLTPKDIDVAEVHDCFTIAEILAIEGLGLFDFGDGWKAVKRGDIKIGGKMPINPSGGLKSKGHPVGATGVAQIYDIVKQLREECGPRQIEGAKIGITDTMGGTFAAIGNIILKRGW